jgi:hypothetical protein
MRWFINKPHDNGGLYYRHTLPLRHLMPHLRDAGIRVTYSRTIDMTVDYDAYFFSRWVKAEYLPLLVEIKRRGKLLVWDLDDDLFGLERVDPRHHDKRAMLVRALELCLDMADVITVSTENLNLCTRRPDKSIVLTNLIDMRDHPIEPRHYGSGGRATILYAGSRSHEHDIELIRSLHHRTQRHFQWVFYGIRPDWISTRDIWIPWCRGCDYPRVLRLIRPLVSVAPLAPDRFNLSKSPIKIWETAAAGASVIASNYGPYAGSTAALAAAGDAFAFHHLGRVLAIPNHDACVAEACANSWQWSKTGHALWLAAFMHIASLCHGKSHVDANQLSGSSAA